MITLQFDGGSCNPGPSGAGFVVRRDGELLAYGGAYEAQATNNEVEYLALLLGLQHVWNEYGDVPLRVLGDSKLVVEQVHGRWKVKAPNLFRVSDETKRAWNRFTKATLEHVRRERNAAADAVAEHFQKTKVPYDVVRDGRGETWSRVARMCR